MSQEIDTRCEKAIEGGWVHGAIFCATNAAGDFSYMKALGQRTLISGEKIPQRADDLLCLASATSLITTIAALQCVEDGTLTLAGDISHLAPELAGKQVITGHTRAGSGGDGGGSSPTPVLEPVQGAPMTLEMLLTHSSGVVFDALHDHVGRWRRAFAPQDPNAQLTVEETHVDPLGFHPGQGWMWGHGIDWVGRIVERVTSCTLGNFVQERVFQPLGITDAQFYPVTREELQQRQVDRHPDDPEGYGKAALGGGGLMNKCAKGDFGGQGLFMTAPDFGKVLQSLLANDGKLLKPATVEGMFRDHLGSESSKCLHDTLTGPLGGFFSPDPAAKVATGHGLGGLVTLEDIENGYGAGTLTWPAAMPILWFIDRKNDLCGFGSIQATLAPGGTSRVPGLKIAFRKGIYVEHAAWKKQRSQMS
ncbi:transesterase protein [Cordyceps javanica]|uniref:Transesterase protein n=1 Tax=Cordyceps javanica TaxID=43265 RepID=A0A545UKU1_9HYPO|nr:transesterase protein [Cordyceps javanica]TQW01577.1 beta-lactamase [Cordyceps javanica]